VTKGSGHASVEVHSKPTQLMFYISHWSLLQMENDRVLKLRIMFLKLTHLQYRNVMTQLLGSMHLN
jgi:hypothetical protein